MNPGAYAPGFIVTTVSRDLNGGVPRLASHVTVPQLELLVNQEFNFIPLYKNKSFLTQKYVQEGLSIAQIADEIRSSKDAIRKGLMQHNIPIREPRNHHGNPSQARYGRQVRKGREVDHQVEQRTIQAIKELHSQKLSLRQIAKILNQMKVPTKCRGKSWHPQMVKRILDYNLVAAQPPQPPQPGG